jgi:hypothetical protein
MPELDMLQRAMERAGRAEDLLTRLLEAVEDGTAPEITGAVMALRDFRPALAAFQATAVALDEARQDGWCACESAREQSRREQRGQLRLAARS